MSISAVWVLAAGRGLTFTGDELFYYASLVAHGAVATPSHGLEYFLAPHNGHMVVVGRLIYRGLFAIAGTDYFVFRAAEVAGYLVCVGLFFTLAWRRVHPFVALAFSVSLLFLGYAQETMLWPFDLHTVYSLAFGLGSLLALERDDRRGDIAACALLVLSVATIEVGLAFAVGVAVSVLLRSDRRRRSWIFLVPLAIYAIWWIWARHFHQETITLTNVRLIPIDLTDSLAAVAGSIFGLNPTGVGINQGVTTVTAAGMVIAGFAVAGLALRIRQGNVPSSLWISLAVVLTFWITVAMGGRPPDSSRYIFVGAVLVFLIAADAIRGIRLSPLAIVGFFVVVAIAIPANIAKLDDGRGVRRVEASVIGTEYGMLDLVRDRVQPGYVPAADPRVAAVGGNLFVALSASDYYRAEEDFGSIGFPPNRVRKGDLMYRQVADETLVGALRIRLIPASPPARPSNCPSVSDATPGDVGYFPISGDGMLLGSRSDHPLSVGLSRFVDGGPGVEIGMLPPGRWAKVETPPDSAPEPWRALVGGPVYVCPLG